MAKTETALDEDLLDGLQQAKKKKPRHFAMITKGPDVVGLIVQKKKILDGQVQKAKKEFKGNLIIQGVCQGQGVELTFEVVGEEPGIKPIKIKEFISERTELTVKPNWAVVKALSEVKEADEDDAAAAPPAAPPAPQPAAAEQAAPPAPPPAPPADGDPLAALTAKMKQLTPAVQAALAANPARKADLLAPVSAFQGQIKAKDVAGAQQSLVAIAKLVKEVSAAAPTSAAPPVAPPPVAPPTSAAPPVAPPPQPTSAKTETPPEAPDPQYTKAKAKFAASRGTWIKVRDQAVGNIRTIRDAMFAQFKDDADLKDNLARGMKELDEVAAKFNDELKNKFDEFTADPPPPAQERERIKREALALIDAYRSEIESNSIYEDLDQREFAQVLVKAPLLKVLAGMAKDLA